MPVNPSTTDPATDRETESEPRSEPDRADGTGTTRAPREPILGLSASQLTGSAAAAATAAALGSRLGLVGTIVGAALISVVTAVAGAVYTRSLQRTKDAVARTAEKLPTVRIPAQREATPDGDRRTTTPWWHRVRWRRVALASLTVFLLAGGIVTGIEQLTGRSLDGTGRSSVSRIIGDGGSSGSTEPRGEPSDSSTSDGSTGSGSGSSGSRDGTGSSTDEGQGQSQSQDPDSTPTPTDEPSTTPTDGSDGGSGSGSGTTQPTQQPTSEPSATPTTGGGS